MKEGFSGKFCFLDGLVVLFVLLLDDRDVACCMLLINSPLPFFLWKINLMGKNTFNILKASVYKLAS